MESIDTYAEQIQSLSAMILDGCDGYRDAIFVRKQAAWNSCHSDGPVILEHLSLIPGLGGLSLSRDLHYPPTEQLTGRLYRLNKAGHIHNVYSNLDENAGVMRNMSRAYRFEPTGVDYAYVRDELQHGLYRFGSTID